jgi:hypothetical protein
MVSEQAGGVLSRRVATAACLLVAAGVVARVVRYVAARPLWSDEATVALMVLERTAPELAVPHAGDPVTPIGFLLGTKAVALLLGSGERALRAIPFAAGLAALAMFHAVARTRLPRREALFALVLFSISEPLIFYASELKPYSTDVLVSLLVLWAGARLLDRSAGRTTDLALAAAAGAVGIWLSLPAIFVCGGLVAALGLRALREWPSRRRVAGTGLLGLVYAGSFAAFYLGTVAPHRSNAVREGWWGPFYPPLELSLDALAWYPRAFFGFFNDPLGLPAVGVAAAAFLAGALRLARRDGDGTVLLLAPLGLAFGASLLRLAPFPTSLQYDLLDGYYPFFGRILLFSVPSALVVLAAGVGWLADLSGRRFLRVGALAIAVLVATPVFVLVRNTLSPPVIQDMRTLADRMGPLVEPSDRILTLQYAEPVVSYYALRDGLPRPWAVLRLRNRSDVRPLLETLAAIPPGQRFWLVTVHHPHWPSRAEHAQLVPLLDRIATPLASFESFRGNAHLYRRR